MNTKTSGAVNFIIYKDTKGSDYTAVCLDFDIVEHGSDPNALRESIEEAAQLHIETIVDMNLNEKLLNRRAPEIYWNRARRAVAAYEESLEKNSLKGTNRLRIRDIWTRNSQELAAI
jgi:predicted RNase H-like HicB family nuclease